LEEGLDGRIQRLLSLEANMIARKVNIKGLDYVGRVIDCGEVFCTVRLLSGTLVVVPRKLVQLINERLFRRVLQFHRS
jgi:hypothetical protein